MKTRMTFLSAIAGLVVFALSASAESKYVILISIDGGAAYHLENPSLELPHIRALIRDGVWAESSETVFPTVTHPSHTTLITGVLPAKHGVLANEMTDKDGTMLAENTLTRSQIILTKTIFDQAKSKGLTTASFYWPETVDDPAIDYNLITRSTPSGRFLVRNAWAEELRQAGIPVETYDQLHTDMDNDAVIDDLEGLAVSEVIRKHKPNLIAVHFLQTDHAQHRFGPTHPLAQAALQMVDASIGRIVRATQAAGIYDATTFIICADHGFSSVQYQLNVRAYLAEAGLENKIRLYEIGSSMFVRQLPSFVRNEDGPKLQHVFNRLRSDPHILHIYNSGEFPALGLPRFEDSSRVPGEFMILSDIDTYLTAAAGGSTALKHTVKPSYGHGSLPQMARMYPLLVLSGRGVKKGTRTGHVHNIDVAPTICELLGLPALDADGHALREALAE